jgi:hypothetical protein
MDGSCAHEEHEHERSLNDWVRQECCVQRTTGNSISVKLIK